MKTLIQNGMIVDPANRICSRLNLLLEGGRIARLSTDAMQADRIIDATGKIVCPGFIDIHMHEDPLGTDGRIATSIFHSMLRMGVTTAVGGNCGDNLCDPVEYLKIVDRDGAPVNVALFAGHSWFRKQAGARNKYGAVTPQQLETMCKTMEGALRGGCAGISFGLRYVPGIDTHEFMTIARLCAESGKCISAHLRDDAAQVFSAVEEVVQAGIAYNLPVQISHIGSMGGFGQMEALLAQIDAYRANGLDIACDCYPYTAFSTGIGETTYDDGWLERYGCDYSACVPSEGRYKGLPCTAERFAQLRREEPDCITVCYVMKDEDVRMALKHPNVMLASDGFVDAGQGHPRAAGAFPRFWHEYVHTGEVDLLTGIAKMTSMPAQRLKMHNKGRLNAGADGDVVIFTPEKLKDCASFDEPMLPPQGLDYVLIGGEIAARNGEIMCTDLGRAVRF